MAATYQRIPSSSRDASPEPEPELSERVSRSQPLSASTVAEFERPAPPVWTRIGIIALIIFLGWLSVRLGGLGNTKPEVIYANRYSEEFKYRPAASPVITEYLKDGRIRIRGATPGGVGVREEDMPKTPAQKKREQEKKLAEARALAKEKLGLKKKRSKKTRKTGDP